MCQYYIVTTVVFLYFFSQEILAESCGEDVYCHAPYRCCELKKECCYDQVIHTNRHLRLQIWNLWYFWFLIIFMMMSCFGGCGYYRRRRLAILTRSSPNDNRPLTVMPSQHRVLQGTPTRGREFTLLAYHNSNVNSMPNSYLPPSYAEIVNHPDLYPSNKIDLPPYSATEKPNDNQTNSQIQARPNHSEPELSLPPPYSACSLPTENSTHVINSNHQKEAQHRNPEDSLNQSHVNINNNNNSQ